MKHTLLKAETPDEMLEEDGEAGGPEYNLGKQYSRRAVFTTDDPNQPYCVVTETAFVNGMVWTYKDGENVSSRDAVQEDLDLPVRERILEGSKNKDGECIVFLEMEEVQMTYCTDPEDPGFTEISTEYEYNDIGYMWQASLEKSEAYCKNHIFATDFETMYF